MLRRFVGTMPILFALLGAIPIGLEAQTGQVNGTVTSVETGQPLGAVQVYLEGTSRASITRADGTFTITNVPPGTYTLVAQSIGYQQHRQENVAIAAGATVSLNLQLSWRRCRSSPPDPRSRTSRAGSPACRSIGRAESRARVRT